MKSVAVLMSTYNGEKYLRQQIDSILSQEDVAIQLYIRDDGSKDGTKAIISEYTELYPNVTFINESRQDNKGVRDSFYEVLEFAYNRCTVERYFAFADQDDVWKSKKMAAAIQKLCSMNGKNGNLYYSNKTFVDKNLQLIKEENITCYNDLMDLFWPSQASGCTMVFDHKLASFAIKYKPKSNCLHDSWIYRLSKCIGANIVFDENSYILYRQHESNVCGIATTVLCHDNMYILRNFIKRLISKRKHKIQNIIDDLYQQAGNDFQEDAVALAGLVSIYNKSIVSKYKLIKLKEQTKRPIKLRLIWKYKILLNMI